MVDYTVIIETFEVLDNERTARINGTSGNVEPKHPGPFKLSNDSDSQFLAMCDIWARMVGVGPGGGFVTVTVDGGDPDEIDKLRIGKAL